MPTLRLLSVNARPVRREQSALTRLIRGAEADVVCVHGSPQWLRWRSRSAALARQAGVVVVGGGHFAGGNLVLSTLGVDVVSVANVSFRSWSPLPPQGAALAMLRLRGTDFGVAATRLTGDRDERLRQVRHVHAALTPGIAMIISADGADRLSTPAWDVLTDGRVAVSGGMFVDRRIGIDSARCPDGVPEAVVVELDLPGGA